MHTRKKNNILKLTALPLIGVILLNVALVRQSDAAAQNNLRNIPYWSDPIKQNELMLGAMDQTYGNDEKNIIGADELYEQAVQMASSLENEVISIIKDDSITNKQEEITKLVDAIYKEDLDYEDPEDIAEFGILNHIEYIYASWLVYPNGDGLDLTRADAARDYYETEAQLSTSLQNKIDNLKAELTIYRNNSIEETELLTEATNFDTGDVEYLPEYAVAATDLHDLVTAEASLITGKTYAYWGKTEHPTLLEIAQNFRTISFIRTKAIYKKYETQKQAQLDVAYEVQKEVNDIMGYVSAAPYDMASLLITFKNKEFLFYALTSPHANCLLAENGFDGLSDATLPSITTTPPPAPSPYSSVEPMDWDGFATMTLDLNTQWDNTETAVNAYRTQYEIAPNLTNSDTYAEFQNATLQINILKDKNLRYISEIIEDLNARVSEANLKIKNLDEIISATIQSLSANSGFWAELKAALVKIVTWLLSLFGRFLNFGLSELNETDSLRQIHGITRGFANIGFVALIAFIGLAISMEWNINAYDLRSLIPRFFASIILVNSSLMLAQLFTDLGLIFSNVLLTQSGRIVANIELFSRVGADGNTLGLSAGAPNLLFGSLLSSSFATMQNSLFSSDLIAVFVLILVFCITSAVNILLAVRTAGLWLLIIASPLVYLIWLVPGAQNVVKAWWKNFFILLILGPAVALIFLIGISLARFEIADDFLRVFIGIGTFALMLIVPSFMMGISLSSKSEKHTTTSSQPMPIQHPAGYQSAAPAQNQPKETEQARSSREYLKNLAKAPDISTLQGKAEAPQAQQLVTQTIQEQTKPANPSTIPATPEKLDVADLIRKQASGMKKEASSPLADIVKRMLGTKQYDDLTARLSTMFKKNALSTAVTGSLFKMQDGLKYLSGLLTNTKQPADIRQMAHGVIHEYYHEQPLEIQSLSAHVQNSDQSISNAALQVLRVGVEALGRDLMLRPQDEKLKDAAKEVVARMPEKLAWIITGSDGDRTNREQAITVGIEQTRDSTHAAADLFTRLSADDVKQLGDALSIPALSVIATEEKEKLAPSHIDRLLSGLRQKTPEYLPVAKTIITTINEKPEAIGEKGAYPLPAAERIMETNPQFAQIDETLRLPEATTHTILTMHPELAKEPIISQTDAIAQTAKMVGQPQLSHNQNAPQVELKPVPTDKKHLAVAVSPPELESYISENLANITPSLIDKLFSVSDQELAQHRGSLKMLADAFNAQVNGMELTANLPATTLSRLAEHAGTLASYGLPLQPVSEKKQEQTILAGKYDNYPADRITRLDDGVFLPFLTAKIQADPAHITPEHIDRLFLGLATDQDQYLPALYQVLSPDAGIPQPIYAKTINALIDKHPDLVLPEHVTASISGLTEKPDLFHGIVSKLASLYHNQNDTLGQEGKLKLDTAATLSMNKDILNGVTPPIILDPHPSPNTAVSASLVKQAKGESIDIIPNTVFYPGIAQLADTQPQFIRPEHIARVIKDSETNPELALPVLQKLASSFDTTDMNHQPEEPLSKTNMLLLASQAQSLELKGIKLDETNLKHCFHEAVKNGLELNNMRTLEGAVKDLGRQMNKAPGSEKSNQKENEIFIAPSETETTHVEGKAELARENVSQEFLQVEQSDAIADYAANATTSLEEAQVIAPDVNVDQAAADEQTSKDSSTVVIDSNLTTTTPQKTQ